MRSFLCVVFVLFVADVYSKSVTHPSISLLPARGKCGVESSTYPPPPADGNGGPAGLAEYPWVALLEYGKNQEKDIKHNCGGVLISERYVLTGGHCVSGTAHKHIGDVVKVRLGEYNLLSASDCTEDNTQCADPVQDIEVESVTVHSNYDDKNKNHYNDIALIRLKTPAPYTDYIRPICLPLNNEETTSGNLILSGWDRRSKDTTKNIKQKASLPFVPSSSCQSSYSNLKIELNESQFCAGGVKGANSCIALGGSPLMSSFSNSQDKYVEGIVSFGPNVCGANKLPDVFTKVSHHIDWILDNIKA